METTERQNLKYCTEAISLKKGIETSFLTLGEYLYNIKLNELYAPQWSEWSVFTDELKMSENTVNKLMQIYETFVLTYKIPAEKVITAGGWTMIQEILPVITNKEEAVQWLKTAEVLTRNDLRKEVREARSKLSPATCKHKNSYIIKVCRDCGHKEEVYET